MLDKALSAWRGRHVLLIGAPKTVRFPAALLEELGAKPALLPPSCGAQELCRALTAHRVAAAIVPRAQELCPARGSASACLARLESLLGEAREAGIPLVALATDAPVYRTQSRPAHEDDPLGGQTREGLIQSLFSLYADAASRTLLGDAMNTLLVHHAPCLGSGAPGVLQYDHWCSALLRGDIVSVEHPAMQGAFVHPAEAAYGLLLLGAMCLSMAQGGSYNLALDPPCLLPNRTAAQRLIARFGGNRPMRESEPPLCVPAQALDGSRAKALCGVSCRLAADEALFMHLELMQAQAHGDAQTQEVVRRQARRILLGSP